MAHRRRTIKVILTLVLCISLMPFSSFADDQNAAQNGNQSGTPAETAAQEQIRTEPATRTSFKWNGYKLKFTTYKVLDGTSLDADSEPLNLKIKVRKKSRKLTWKAPRNAASVDGFIILRRSGKKGAYKQYAVLGQNARSFVDKKAKKKNKYSYTVVGFRQETYGIRISPCSGEGRAPGRAYQNPSKYVQISDSISRHGLGYYTSPVLVNRHSSKKDHIEAMIKTAYKYKGDPYVVCRSGEPGKGLDCSGLVMQACYGAGVDLWPVNPWRHRLTKYEYESRNIAKMSRLKTVAYKNRQRGDLIFFCNSRGTIIHVAIYLGNNQIIHSTSVGSHVVVTGMGGGAYGRPCKVKRIFN